MNFTGIFARYKAATVELKPLRSTLLAAAASSLLVIGWTLAPKPALPEILRFLPTAFVVLLLPGLWLLWAFPGLDGGDWLKRLPLAFTLSYAMWSIPIFVIMRLHASWETFYMLFAILNLLIPLLAVWQANRHGARHLRFEINFSFGRLREKISRARLDLATILLVVLLLASAAAVVPLSSSGYIDGDVLTHVAMIRNVLESPRFSLEEPLFGAGLPVPTRGAANPWLLLPAFMARVAGIDPLSLINTYLPPLLAILAVLSVYLLVSDLSGNRSLALFTAVFFVIYLAAEPFHRHGNQSYILFRRIISDKHFLLAILLPAGIVFAHRYLQSGGRRYLALFGLTGLGIALTHSLVALFLLISTSAFAGSYFLIEWINQQAFSKKILLRTASLAAVTVVLMALPILQSRKESDRISYLFLNDLSRLALVRDETLVSPVSSLPALGVPGGKVPNLGEVQVENANPYLVRRLYGQLKAKGLLVLSPTMFMSHPDLLWDPGVVLALILTPFLLLWVRKDRLALYLFTITLTYPLINFNPYVAPLASRFVTPWLLYRFTWPLPLILTLAYFLFKLASWLEKPLSQVSFRRLNLVGLPALVMLVLLATWLSPSIREFSASLLDKRNPAQVFSDEMLGYVRDHASRQPAPGSDGEVILSDYSTNLVFAAYFDHPNLVAHRYNTTSEEFIASRQDEALQRSLDVDYFSEADWMDNRIRDILQRYSVDYVLVRSNRTLNCQLSFFPAVFEELHRDRAYSLYRVKSPIPDDPTIQANSWLLEGNLESALSAFQQALALQPDSLPALLGTAEVYTRNGEPSLALEYLQQAGQASGSNPCVLQALAAGYFHSGELEKAAETYQQAARAAPWDESPYRALGDVYLLQDRFTDAQEAYRRSIAIQLDIDPFSFKELNTTQQTKTGILSSAPGATSDEAVPRIPSYKEAVAEFFSARLLPLEVESNVNHSPPGESAEGLEALSKKPGQPQPLQERLASLSYYQAGNYFLSEKEYAQALAAFRQAVQSAMLELDWALDARLAMGLTYKEMGSVVQAVEIFKQIPSHISSVTEPYLEIARIYHDRGENQAALQLYEQAIQIYPEDLRAFLGKAEIYLEQGNEILALEEYEKALAANPSSSQAWNAIGELFIRQGKLDQARQAFFKSIELTPVNEPAYLGLATVYQQEGRINAMLASARNAIISAPNSSNAYIYLGDAHRAQRNVDQAISAYNRAIQLNPIEAAAYSKLVSIRPGPQLAADIEAQLEAFSFRSEPSGSVWSVLANAYYQQADFQQARTFYQRAIQTDSSLTQAYIGLAELDLIMSNNRSSALQRYQQAIQSDPGSIRGYSEVADFYLAQGQLEVAQQAYQGLIADFPDQAVGYLGLNNVYRRMGEMDLALESLRQAVENNPLSAEVYMAYADQLLQNGDLAAAREMYTQGLRIDPGTVNSLSVIERITRVLGSRTQVRELIDRSGNPEDISQGARVALALLLESNGEFDQAEQLLLDVREEDPLNPAFILQLGEFYQRRQRWEEAKQLFNQALVVAPFDATISLEIASTYANMKQFDEAEEWFQKAQALDASDPSASIGMAEVNKTRGRWESALENLQFAAELAPFDPNVHLALGDLYRTTGNLAEAEAEFEQACDLDKSQLTCYFSLGALYESTHRWQAAQGIYAQIIEYAPYEASSYVNLARIFQQTGQSERAGHVLNRGLESSLDKEYILVNRAQYYASLRQWDLARLDLETASRGDLHSVFSEIRLAQFLIQRGQTDEGLAILQSIERQQTAEPASKTALGDYYAQLAEWDTAAGYYRAALEVDPAYTVAALGLAYVQRMRGNPEQAEQVINSVIQLAPDNPELHLAIGDLELNRLNIAQALQAYQRALELAPNLAAAYWRLERIAHIQGNADVQLQRLEERLDNEPTPDLYVELGQLYQSAGRWQEAFALFQQSSALFPQDGDTWLALGNYYQYFGEWELALEAFEKALEHSPGAYQAWQSTGSIFQTMGRLEEAQQSFLAAIELDRTQVSGYISLANLLDEIGQREAAIETLNQAIQENPGNTEGYLYLSQLYKEKKENQQALEVIQLGISRLPGAAELHAARGENLQGLAFDLLEEMEAERTGDPDEQALEQFQLANQAELERIQLLLGQARAAYEQALQLQPANATALVGQGQIAAQSGDHEKALEYYQRATQFNPLMDKAWVSIGDYYLQQKDWQAAYQAFYTATQLSPSNPRARVGLSEAMAKLNLTGSNSAAFSIQNSLFLWDRMVHRAGRNPTRAGRLQ